MIPRLRPEQADNLADIHVVGLEKGNGRKWPVGQVEAVGWPSVVECWSPVGDLYIHSVSAVPYWGQPHALIWAYN